MLNRHPWQLKGAIITAEAVAELSVVQMLMLKMRTLQCNCQKFSNLSHFFIFWLVNIKFIISTDYTAAYKLQPVGFHSSGTGSNLNQQIAT